jgi:hypothetical protein
MGQFKQPTDEQRRVIDVVVETWMQKGSWVLGREIRLHSKLRDVPDRGAVLSSCVPYYLSVRGPNPSESYQATLAGLVASRATDWVSRSLEGVVRHLAKTIRENPGASEYALTDLRKSVPDFATTDWNRVYDLLQITRLTPQAISMPGNEYRFMMPEHIEAVESWSSFGDLLDFELSRIRSIDAEQPSEKVDGGHPSKKRVEFETTFHKYQWIGQVDQGFSGVVIEVEDETGARFALKRFRAKLPGSIHVKRFENELNFGARTRHRNIIRVVDSGFEIVEDKKVPFYVMPLYAGTLRKRIKAGLGQEEALRIFRDIAIGLSAAHAEEIWHRDLKPENVLIADDGAAVIADFGIAHFVSELQAAAVVTQPSERLANFEYAAPEQRRPGGVVTGAADVYALGLILNEMFTGEVPHGDDYRKIADRDLALSGLDTLVSMMRSQAPKKRPSAEELHALLERAVDGKLESLA